MKQNVVKKEKEDANMSREGTENQNQASFCNRDSKITVAGLGGVGGYLGALLAAAYPNVTFLARGERKQALEKDGIHLYSEYKGNITARPRVIAENGKEIQEIQDYIFICVKNYSLEGICRDLQGCADEHTVIVPVMNGADTGERVRKFFPKGIVTDAVIYITAFYREDFSIVQIGEYAWIETGGRPGDQAQKEGAKRAAACMQGAGIDCRLAQDIEAAVWEKYMFNCAYNVLTAYYMEMAETLQESPEKCREFKTLLEEAYAVAMAKGLSIRQGYVESEYSRFLKLDVGSTSSLKRDMEAGKQSELETFSGYLLEEASRLGVEIPLSEDMYRQLKKRSAGQDK